jgi:spore maturation protein CgeB
MKILLIGAYDWPWYQEACAHALECLGHKVVRFAWLERFKKWQSNKVEPVYRSIWHRIQYRFIIGPIIRNINIELIEIATNEKPDVIWFYNVNIVSPLTLKKLRKLVPDAVFCQYSNDNPFSLLARKSMWRHYIASIPFFDLHHAYRVDNIEDYFKFRAQKVYLLRAYFIPESDYPINIDDIDPTYHCDVVFAGHYEDDGRVEVLEAIARAGYNLKLYGGGWGAALPKLSSNSPLRRMFPIQPVTGRNYNQALCGAKVALCFLSTLNQDTYTRRCFQIPAMKVPMLSQRTDDLASLFIENKEVVFFSDTEELLDKLQRLLENAELRKQIAEAGYARVYSDGHDITSRMQLWINSVKTYKSQKENTGDSS